MRASQLPRFIVQLNGEQRPAKRLKINEILHSDEDEQSCLDTSHMKTPAEGRKAYTEQIPNLDEDYGSDEEPRYIDQARTEIECALPSVRTDKEAIADYESTRDVGDGSSLGLGERVEARNLSRGRCSIYVDAFNLALEAVLEDEGHLFDEVETEVFKQWRALNYEAQYL